MHQVAKTCVSTLTGVVKTLKGFSTGITYISGSYHYIDIDVDGEQLSVTYCLHLETIFTEEYRRLRERDTKLDTKITVTNEIIMK